MDLPDAGADGFDPGPSGHRRVRAVMTAFTGDKVNFAAHAPYRPCRRSVTIEAHRTPPPLRRIVLGVTGGIAAYKAAELTRLFVKAGIAVDVVMTEAASRFVSPMTFQALSGRPVLTDLWASGADNAMGHIAVSRGADAIVVAPAIADFLAKLAHGHADDLLSTLCASRANARCWWRPP